MEVYSDTHLDIFSQPSRLIVSGYSNSGKTVLVTNLVRKYIHKFDSVLISGVSNHELEKEMEIVKVFEEIINPFDYVDEQTKGLLYILDDCFLDAVKNDYVVNAFTKGRHKNISIILITQNLFFAGKHSRTISLNCSHFILLKNRDNVQIETIARQLFGKCKTNQFLQIYKKALTLQPYGYLRIDLTPKTPESLQLRTNIVGEQPCEIVFQW